MPRDYDDEDELDDEFDDEDVEGDDDECEEEWAEEDEEDHEDEEEILARIERKFREERAKIRATSETYELRAMRSEYQRALTDEDLHDAGRIRLRDLIELVDDRLTDIKARRLTRRGW